MGRTACREPQCLYKGALYHTSVPVQGCTLPYLSACTRVHFTLPQCLYKGALYLASVPVQGCILPYLSACTRVHFTLPQCLYKGALYLTSVPVQGRTLPYLSACTRVQFPLPQCLYKGALYLTSVPVQGCTLPYLSACTRVHFTFTSVPVQGCTLPFTLLSFLVLCKKDIRRQSEAVFVDVSNNTPTPPPTRPLAHLTNQMSSKCITYLFSSFGISYFDEDLWNICLYYCQVLTEFKESALHSLFWCDWARVGGADRSCVRGSVHVPFIPYPTAFPYGNGTVLHFYQQQESSTTKTVHKVINKGLKAYV